MFQGILLWFVASQAFAGETMYVQSVKAALKSEPSADGQALIDLARGDEVSVLSKQGFWLEVTAKGKKGWISKLMVNSIKPVGKAELQADLKNTDSLEKAARARPKGTADQVASSRGLSATERKRVGQDAYDKDYETVNQMEKTRVKSEDIDNFVKAANLTR